MEQNSSSIQGDFSRFLTLPMEKIVLARREHWITLLTPLFFLFFFLILFFSISIYVFIFLLPSLPLLIITVLTFSTFVIHLITKMFIQWHLHIYLITTHKILELKYVPFGSTMKNDILLNQVRCTEVDTMAQGIIHQVFDIGNIVLTFDRPTHQQEFIIFNVKNYRRLGGFLSSHLTSLTQQDMTKQNWFKSKEEGKQFFVEEQLYGAY